MFPLTDESYARLAHQGPYFEPGYPFYPFSTPGMPYPGPGFLAYAKQFGDTTEFVGRGRQARIEQVGNIAASLYFQALYDPYFTMPISSGGRTQSSRFLKGHMAHLSFAHWREEDTGERVYGPRRAAVMVVSKWPGRDEDSVGLNFVGPTSQHLWTACYELGIDDATLRNWYLTNLIRFTPPEMSSSRVPTGWIADCMPLLHQELRIVRPQYILCIGSDASRAVTAMAPEFAGAKEGLGVEAMRGRVVQLTYPVHEAGQRPEYAAAQIMTIVHPAQVHRTPDLMDDMRRGLNDFWRLASGHEIGGRETDIDHRVISDPDELGRLVDEIVASNNPEDKILAVDAEWHGQKPWESNAYLRTVQFSHRPKFAACVMIRHPGGAIAMDPEKAASHLRRLFFAPGMRVGGHFFRSDIPWIHHFLGIDLRPLYAPANTPEGMHTSGGWDTSLMEHAINETGLLGLEILRAKYATGVPPYEIALAKWRKRYCAANKIEEDEIEGFGEWDSPDFYEYANYDADATRRIVGRLFQLMRRDRFGHDCSRACWITHRASLAVMEMEQTGIIPDTARALELSQTFSEIRNVLVTELRNLVNWQDFNPNSDVQCRGVLFGHQFARKAAPPGWPEVQPGHGQALGDVTGQMTKALNRGEWQLVDGDQNWLYILPSTVRTQNLTPVTSTGKRPVAWEKVVAKNETHLYSPSTGRETLGILSHGNVVASVLRDIRFLTKALQTVLRPPNTKDTGEYERDSEGDLVYEKGLLSFTSSDGRIHTRMLQTMETGRSSSSKPPLQNISKRREDDFKRIMGYLDPENGHMGSYAPREGSQTPWLPQPRYTHAQRTIFKSPRGSVFIEADYTGAELAGIMWMANDPQGIEDVRRNMLPESHPDYFDIHSNSAVMAFGLDCKPTKKALKAIGKPGLRVAAKNVNFGIPYGRGAEAIARQCREEGVRATQEDAQRLIDYYFHRYKNVQQFLAACAGRTMNPMWMCGSFGRYRRFYSTDDRQVAGEQERQACNFPIQNMVADAVWTALANMWEYRILHGIDFRFVLQIHDAILLEVPFASVPRVYRNLFPECMVQGVDVWPCDLNGNRIPRDAPYHLGSDREIMFRWGESVDDLIEDRFGKDHPSLTKLLEDPANDRRVIELLQSLEMAA